MKRSILRFACLVLAMSLLSGCVVYPPGGGDDGGGWHYGQYHDGD